MITTLNEQGQIILPLHIREALGWEPGSKLVLDANEKGELVLRAERIAPATDPDRFEQARGILPPWPGGTDAYMAFIRGED
jgi:AbrB family looped-hinge helix DNA binding protein